MVVRGKQALYNNIIPNALGNEPQHQKQNTDLRDDALAARYYFHANLERYPYEDCLLMLNETFFISPDQIIKRLSNRTDLLKKMIGEKTSIADLKKQFPHYNWSSMRIVR